jgi:hypothetical protein
MILKKEGYSKICHTTPQREERNKIAGKQGGKPVEIISLATAA